MYVIGFSVSCIMSNHIRINHEKLPWACIIKPFTAIINTVAYQVSAFVIVGHFLLALTNTLAFYATQLITAVNGCMIQAT